MTHSVRSIALVVVLLGLWIVPRAAHGGLFDCTRDSDCDDGLFCNGIESCDIGSGTCVAISSCPPFINGCASSGGCDEATDSCLIDTDDAACDDGFFCNGIESCNAGTGTCVAISSCPPFINGCASSGGCDEATDSCLIDTDDGLCDDGVFCNGIESCDAGTGDCTAESACPSTVDGCLVVGCTEVGSECLVTRDEDLCSGLLSYEFSVTEPEGAVAGDFVYDPDSGDTQLFGVSAAISIHSASGNLFDYAAASWDDAIRGSGQSLGLNTGSTSNTSFTFAFDSTVTLAAPLPVGDFDPTSTFDTALLDGVLRARGSDVGVEFSLSVPEPNAALLAAASFATLVSLAHRRRRARVAGSGGGAA